MHTEDINKTEYLHMMKNFCILPLHLQHTDIVISSLKFKTKNQVEPVNHVVVLFNTFKTMSDSIGSGVEGLLRGCGRVRITLCLLPPLSLILSLFLLSPPLSPFPLPCQFPHNIAPTNRFSERQLWYIYACAVILKQLC